MGNHMMDQHRIVCIRVAKNKVNVLFKIFCEYKCGKYSIYLYLALFLLIPLYQIQ